MSISKVLIANRGEIAVRIIEACRELDLQTVAIYSEPDRYQPHVGLAGESYCIGPGDPEESYLNFPAVMSAADISGADAIHPGYGFLAENSHFAEVCEDHGMRFIGPTSKVLQKAGDKLESKKMAKKAGAQILSGSLKPISSEQELRSQADDLGYPLIVKAALGGGGRGMRVVEGEEELLNAFKTSKQEAQKAFGNDDIYLESFLEEPKHIEVQVIADTQGNITDIGERDCSIQRRHQKLIEEAPAPHLPEEVRREIRATAVAIAEEFGYRSLGTVEFLVDGELDFYFIELNARLQVEHPVSEEIFGCNMIKDQLRLADGGELKKSSYTESSGHAIECRMNAEDPSQNFVPSPGKISVIQLPGGHGVRVDTWIRDGLGVHSAYDSLLGKIIVHGETRHAAILKAISALRRFEIKGVKTTRDMYLDLLTHPEFRSGSYSIHFLENFMRSAGAEKSLRVSD